MYSYLKPWVIFCISTKMMHADQALLSSTPMSESPVTPNGISIELFLVNAGTGFQ